MKITVSLFIVEAIIANFLAGKHVCKIRESGVLSKAYEESNEIIGRGSIASVKSYSENKEELAQWALKRTRFDFEKKSFTKEEVNIFIADFSSTDTNDQSEKFKEQYLENSNPMKKSLYKLFRALHEADVLREINNFSKRKKIVPEVRDCEINLIESEFTIQITVIVQIQRIEYSFEETTSDQNFEKSMIRIFRDQDIERRLSFYFQLAEAIDLVHACGYIHGDIKLSNVLIDSKFNPYLTDFGLSLDLNAIRKLQGTWDYIHPGKIPDWLNNEDFKFTYSEDEDIYAFVVLFYKLEAFYKGSKPDFKFVLINTPDYPFGFSKVITQSIMSGEMIDSEIGRLADRNSRISDYLKARQNLGIIPCEEVRYHFKEEKVSSSSPDDCSIVEFFQKISSQNGMTTKEKYATRLGRTMLVYYYAFCLGWYKAEKKVDEKSNSSSNFFTSMFKRKLLI
jgi:serine/threonine protein kinase